MWGIIPAAGMGSRIQPLAFSKELLPVAGTLDGQIERPKAVSEFLVDRMLKAGVTKLCFVISPGKCDIVQYFGTSVGGADVVYLVQQKPAGLCDAIFRACPFVAPGEHIVVGLPDTVWFPDDGLCALGDQILSFLLFPVDRPEVFDAVVTDEAGFVREIQVKHPDAATNWIWGAFKMPGRVLHELHRLWLERGRRDEYIGTLVNAYLERGGRALGIRRGESYVDVGTLQGYRHAVALLGNQTSTSSPSPSGNEPSSSGNEPLGSFSSHTQPPTSSSRFSRDEIQQRVRSLGEWFHNIDLHGVHTAPDHFLGDFPSLKWRKILPALPGDLTGKTVLDIGCNGGFHAIQMKKRGAARVLGIDFDDYYLDQARFAADVLDADVEFRRMSVYDVAQLGERFDIVLFMGTFYHLRHPLLALDLIREHVTKDLLVFQSLLRGTADVEPLASDYDFWETEIFERAGYPKMHFVEQRYAHDDTNRWIPNRACVEAMLRNSGFEVLAHPEEESFVCRCTEVRPGPAGARAVYPARASTVLA
jgi:tRNA (mo5U34)-methyltransferase